MNRFWKSLIVERLQCENEPCRNTTGRERKLNRVAIDILHFDLFLLADFYGVAKLKSLDFNPFL